MSFRYRFEVDWENKHEWGVGVVPGHRLEGAQAPTGTELASVLRQLATQLDAWPGKLAPVRYPARPTGDA